MGWGNRGRVTCEFDTFFNRPDGMKQTHRPSRTVLTSECYTHWELLMSGPDETDVSVASSSDETREEDKGLRWRRVLTLVLVVLTSVSLVSAAVAIWTHQVVFDTDRFMKTVEPVLNDDRVYVLVGDKATDSLLKTLGVEDRLKTLLGDLDSYISDALTEALPPDSRLEDLVQRINPPTFAQLAPPIAGAIESRIDSGVHAFFNADNFAEPLTTLTRRAHEVVVALVRADVADYPNVYIQDGEVKLDLTAFIGQALSNVADDVRAVLPDFAPPDVVADRVDDARDQIASAIQASLPEDFGQVTLMSADVLSEAQDAAARLDRYAWTTGIVSVVLLITTLLVSPIRRKTLLHLGIGLFVAVVVAAITIRQLETSILANIVDPQGSALAGDVVRDVLSGLRRLELFIAVGAILIGIVAYVAGRPDRISRQEAAVTAWTQPEDGGSMLDRWVARHAEALQVIGIVAAAVLLFFVGLDWVSIIVIAVVLAGYLWIVSAATRRVANGPGTTSTVSAESADTPSD